ncbi:MAG: hypothetical protein JW740_03165 [Candidatus Zambryskibacteria bacterium]|nr:hypothetical protein [Candidatus Zambryskibacteria bacterium]
MTSEEFKNLYTLQDSDESITPFQNELGFSLIRRYPENTVYNKDNRRMFIKIAILNQKFFYSVDMTKPEKREDSTNYIISDGEEYNKKITNFVSDGGEFTFDETTQKVIHQPTNKSFTLNEFADILAANHLSDRLFLKRILNWFADRTLRILFWLSDSRYERIQTSIDKYHYSKGENLPKDEKKNIEPFFKYFYISKNILFAFLLIALPSAIFLGHLWIAGEFSLSNPSIVLLFFLVLFSCEKASIWLDKKIKGFLMPEEDHFAERKINFVEKMHDFQYRNKFKIKLKKNNKKNGNKK